MRFESVRKRWRRVGNKIRSIIKNNKNIYFNIFAVIISPLSSKPCVISWPITIPIPPKFKDLSKNINSCSTIRSDARDLVQCGYETNGTPIEHSLFTTCSHIVHLRFSTTAPVVGAPTVQIGHDTDAPTLHWWFASCHPHMNRGLIVTRAPHRGFGYQTCP